LTAHRHDLTIRPITGPGELEEFNRFPHQFNEELAADLSDGHRRPEWLWIALRDGRPAARAGWWGKPGDERPHALDILDLDDSGRPETVDIAAGLLSTAMAEVIPDGTRPPDYLSFVDPDWRAAPATRQPAEDRMVGHLDAEFCPRPSVPPAPITPGVVMKQILLKSVPRPGRTGSPARPRTGRAWSAGPAAAGW
jgi:hypothetical protein